ncbi:MAG TPA: hypothetical protein VHC69_20970 [Polyangiaceae bacterium]|nr:hypothetical protein [Polyangiaceae bacterium]
MKKTFIVRTFIGCLACTACGSSTNSEGGKVQFTASGEVLALGGYAFPPATSDDPAFVDGWEVRFSKFLTTIDHITLSENPDTSPTDQSKTGKKIAELDGPWAIDLHEGGPLEGKGGSDEQAYPIATLANQNKNGGAPFDSTVRYAFGFDLVPATDSAKKLQLASDDPDYADMVTNGWVVLYVGTATWKGGSSCTSTDSSFDFSKLPSPVNFRFGFKSPTTYVNCQNPDNDPAKGLDDEEHQRGVQVKANQTVTAQVTVHTDHPFWESFVHDSPAHFDQLAALATKDAQGNYNVTLDDTTGVDYTAFESGSDPLPWRSCLSTYTPPNMNKQMGFDSLTIPYNPSGDPSTSMRDYHDYMTYDQSTQGHLNSDGLCFVERHYPSPP